eukprot:GHVR01150103.1.p1 GENE.GHVR01150103.1~~GHVR01150103.1.p1  ORF type:complete len:232 (-),score=102.86 GHVR01150103.1:733-1377(-)
MNTRTHTHTHGVGVACVRGCSNEGMWLSSLRSSVTQPHTHTHTNTHRDIFMVFFCKFFPKEQSQTPNPRKPSPKGVTHNATRDLPPPSVLSNDEAVAAVSKKNAVCSAATRNRVRQHSIGVCRGVINKLKIKETSQIQLKQNIHDENIHKENIYKENDIKCKYAHTYTHTHTHTHIDTHVKTPKRSITGEILQRPLSMPSHSSDGVRRLSCAYI